MVPSNTSSRPKPPKMSTRARRPNHSPPLHDPIPMSRATRRKLLKQQLRDQHAFNLDECSESYQRRSYHWDNEVEVNQDAESIQHDNKFAILQNENPPLRNNSERPADISAVNRLLGEKSSLATNTPRQRLALDEARELQQMRDMLLYGDTGGTRKPLTESLAQVPHGRPLLKLPPVEIALGFSTKHSAKNAPEVTGSSNHYIPSPLLYHKRSREILSASLELDNNFRLDDDTAENRWDANGAYLKHKPNHSTTKPESSECSSRHSSFDVARRQSDPLPKESQSTYRTNDNSPTTFTNDKLLAQSMLRDNQGQTASEDSKLVQSIIHGQSTKPTNTRKDQGSKALNTVIEVMFAVSAKPSRASTPKCGGQEVKEAVHNGHDRASNQDSRVLRCPYCTIAIHPGPYAVSNHSRWLLQTEIEPGNHGMACDEGYSIAAEDGFTAVEPTTDLDEEWEDFEWPPEADLTVERITGR